MYVAVLHHIGWGQAQQAYMARALRPELGCRCGAGANAGRASLPEASRWQRKMVIWPLIDGAQTAFCTHVFGHFQQLQGLLCMLLQRVAWIG